MVRLTATHGCQPRHAGAGRHHPRQGDLGSKSAVEGSPARGCQALAMAGPGKVDERVTAQDQGRRGPRFASSKFAPPKAGFHLVHRARLMERLDIGEDARLTLVVASAGAGKT